MISRQEFTDAQQALTELRYEEIGPNYNEYNSSIENLLNTCKFNADFVKRNNFYLELSEEGNSRMRMMG